MGLPDLNLPSPLQVVSLPLLDKRNIQLYIKREDLIHPVIGGNKWRKLKYNIKYALDHDIKKMVTFGGAFSNHIHAFAGVCKLYGLMGKVFLRGEIDRLNPTIAYVSKMGVEIHSMSREEYRKIRDIDYLGELENRYTDAMIIPEGGSNVWGYQGVREIMSEVNLNVDRIAIAAGTGCTAAGVIDTSPYLVEVVGVLKGDFLINDIQNWFSEKRDFTYLSSYHWGGYAKTKPKLINFINRFYILTGIPLDPIYTGKAMYAILHRIEEGVYPAGTKILFIHTGGLQGIAGYNYRAGENLIQIS